MKRTLNIETLHILEKTGVLIETFVMDEEIYSHRMTYSNIKIICYPSHKSKTTFGLVDIVNVRTI